MTSLERVLATVRGQAVDRRAVVPILSLYGARLAGFHPERYFTDPEAYARGQAAVREVFAPDVLFAPFCFAGLGAAFGGELVWYADQAPNVRRPAVRDAAGFCALALPDPDADPFLRFLRGALRQLVRAHGATVPVAVPLPPPMDLPALVMGMEAWLETVLFDAAGAARVLDRVIPWFTALANACFADGAAFVAMPTAFASPAIVTREVAWTFARPALAAMLAGLAGPAVLHHGGAPLGAHVEIFAGLPGVVAVVLDERDETDRARTALGPGPVLFQGPSGPFLPRCTAASLTERCRSLLAARRGDARFILSTTGPDVPWDTPPENVAALGAAAAAEATAVAASATGGAA